MIMMTYDQALAFDEARAWKDMTGYQRAVFQLSEERLCMPFSIFHAAVEQTLGRDVFVHELANSAALLAELVGTREPPTLTDIINMIPEDKRIIVDLSLPNRNN